MKKLIKNVTAAVLVLVLTLSLTACGAKQDPTQQARTAVEGMFQAIKTLDFEELNKYTDAKELLGNTDELAQLPGSEDFLKSLLGKVGYEILGAEQADEETVYVFAQISAVDMKPVFSQFMTRAMEYVMAHMFDDPAPTDEQIETEIINILVQLLAADELQMVNTNVEIPVRKTENGWFVETDDDLLDALLGGLEEAAEEFTSTFG